jgi:hypothetical protein
MEIELRRLIGHRVIVMGPTSVDNEKLQSVKLLALEEAGIWIESQEAVDKIIGSPGLYGTTRSLGEGSRKTFPREDG